MGERDRPRSPTNVVGPVYWVKAEHSPSQATDSQQCISRLPHDTRKAVRQAARRSDPEHRDGRQTATGAVKRRCASQPRAPSEQDEHTAPRRTTPTILALEPSILIPIYLVRIESLMV
ncbi:unnamed protein product [Euphydryas editha]|uniref:Uncharacterized protein n=1 Tax=Euphydryas editha TaxID=104508 RepID=A0AAU9VBD2_EUPED|nr:unnamed protein product [Euphydryas editha]